MPKLPRKADGTIDKRYLKGKARSCKRSSSRSRPFPEQRVERLINDT